jgi:UPF0755 protein
MGRALDDGGSGEGADRGGHAAVEAAPGDRPGSRDFDPSGIFEDEGADGKKPAEPPRRRRLNPFLKALIGIGIVGLIFFGKFWYGNLLLAPIDTRKEAKLIRVEIPPGATLSRIASELKKVGLIRSTGAFGLMARVLGESNEMKAGEYEISPNLGVIEIINKLVAGDAIAHSVVVPEGLTLRQVAAKLSNQRVVNSDRFLRAAARKPKYLGLQVPVARRSVDGYLMPDTYKFQKGVGERQVLKEMLANWNRKVLRPNQELFRKSSLPMDKVIILASLIEREARVPQDRAKISSVIHNRLRRKMKLDIDATVIYALGFHKEALSFADLKVDSPYNTYRNVGLPPGPICNPGADSVLAALQPANTPYLYYVAQPDGSHIFGASYQEHKANIARVKQMRGS